jgi:hypothetical protein
MIFVNEKGREKEEKRYIVVKSLLENLTIYIFIFASSNPPKQEVIKMIGWFILFCSSISSYNFLREL